MVAVAALATVLVMQGRGGDDAAVWSTVAGSVSEASATSETGAAPGFASFHHHPPPSAPPHPRCRVCSPLLTPAHPCPPPPPRYRGVSGSTMQQVPPTSQVMARAAELLRQVINREDSATPSPLAAHASRAGVSVGMLAPSHLGDAHYSSPPAHHPRYAEAAPQYQPQRRAARGSDAGVAGGGRAVDGNGYGSGAYGSTGSRGASRGGSHSTRHSQAHHSQAHHAHGHGGSVRGLGAGMLGGDRMGGAAGVAPASLVHAHAHATGAAVGHPGHHHAHHPHHHHLAGHAHLHQPHGSSYSFKSAGGSSVGYGPRRGPSVSRLHGAHATGAGAVPAGKRGSRRPSRGSGKSRGNPRLRVKGMGKAVHTGMGGVPSHGAMTAGAGGSHAYGPAGYGQGYGHGPAYGRGGAHSALGDAHMAPPRGHNGRDTRVLSAAVRALDVVEHLPVARAADVSNGLFVPGAARGAAVAASSSVAGAVGGGGGGGSSSRAGHGHGPSGRGPAHASRRHAGAGDGSTGAQRGSGKSGGGSSGGRPHSGKAHKSGKRGHGKVKKSSGKKKSAGKAKGKGGSKRRTGAASASSKPAAASSSHVTDASSWMRGASTTDG